MANQVLTKQKLIDADEDVQALEDVVNGEPGQLIKTRLGREVYTLASVPQINTMTREEVNSALALKAPQATTYTKVEVDTTFAAYVGGRKAYTTLALAQAAQSSLPANTAIEVTNDPTSSNNGTYQWNGTTLTKSAYDLKPVILNEVNTLSNQKFQDSIKNGTYEIGDLVELTLRQENSLNARYLINAIPVESNFKPTPHTMRACYADPISVVGGSVIRVSSPVGYSIGITQAEVVGGTITADSGWLEGEKSLKLNANTKYIGVSVRKNDDSTFDLTTLNTLDFKIAFLTGKASSATNALSKMKQKPVTERYKAMEFWNGSFGGAGYAAITAPTRLSRIKALPVVGGSLVKITAPSGFNIAVVEFSELGNPAARDTGWYSNSIEITLLPTTRYIHTNVRLPNEATIDLSVLDSQTFEIEYTRRSELIDTSTIETNIDGLFAVNNQTQKLLRTEDFGQGTIDSVLSPLVAYSTRVTTHPPIDVSNYLSVDITIPEGYNLSVVQGSSPTGAATLNSGWQVGTCSVTLADSFIVVLVKKIDDSDITPTEVGALGIMLNFTALSGFKRPIRNAILDLVATSVIETGKANFNSLQQAHGGITTFGAPFDSIDAIIHASRIGFKIAETDIVMTSDNEFVCMHDMQYNNTYFTNIDGSDLASAVNVNSLTLAQAQSQFLQRSSVAKYRKPVQTVDQYLETCFRYGLEPYIEIKQMNISQAARLANKAKKFFAPEEVTFISFDQSHLTALNNYGNFKFGLLAFTSTNALIDQVKAFGSNFFVAVMHNTLTQAVKDYADSKGVLVSVWTITTSEQLNSYFSRGVQLIATDDLPPTFDVKGGTFKSYTSGLTFSDFVLNNAVVNGGVLELQAGGSAEFTFDVGAKNIAFLSDIIGKGEFTYSLKVAGNTIDYVQISSAKDVQAKLNKLAVSTTAIGLLIQATSFSKISDLTFDVIEAYV